MDTLRRIATETGLTVVATLHQVETARRYAGDRPHRRVTIGARGENEFTLRIEVSQATSEPSDQCPDASFTTGFVIDDGGNAPVAVATQESWLCFGRGVTA